MRRLRLLTATAGLFWLICACGPGCGDRGVEPAPDAYVPPTLEETNVDILVVADDSWGTRWVLEATYFGLWAFLEELSEKLGGKPNIHVGMVTSNLGTDGYDDIPGCTRIGGDRGILGQVAGRNLGDVHLSPDQHYAADVWPVGCSVSRSGGTCTAHDCVQHNCDLAVTPGSREKLQLVRDFETNCPRCRNYPSSGQGRVPYEYLVPPDEGCGFEHLFEAVRKALDPADPDAAEPNEGFLRDDSFLVVIFATDEDDCSAQQPEVLFDPDPELNKLDSPLGPLTSFRCFEFGITCDVDDRTVEGPRHDCRVRDAEDSKNLLYPLDRYVSFFEALRDPTHLLVIGVSGPAPETVEVFVDRGAYPTLRFACVSEQGGGAALPAFRLWALVDALSPVGPEDPSPHVDACQADYRLHFRRLADLLARRIQTGR